MLNLQFNFIETNSINFYISLVKGNEIKRISRDKIKPYKEIKNSNTYLFIFEGESYDFIKFTDELNFVNIENIKKLDEAKLSNICIENKIFNYFEEYINKKETLNLVNIKSIEDYNNPLPIHNQNQSNNFNNQITRKNSLNNHNITIKKRNSTKNEEKIKMEFVINNNFINNLNSNINNTPVLENFITSSTKYKYIIKITRLHPEKNQVGILLIDLNKLSEFIPLINNPTKKTIKFNSYDVRFIVKYRYLYKYKALNIFLFNSKKPKIFIFESEKDANEIYNFYITFCTRIDKTKLDIKYQTNLWVEGFMSNFDYLIYLNEMASRSFNDLSQYPVMPWIINNFDNCDYDVNNYRDLTKPIGAQNPIKLKNIREFYYEAKEDNEENPYFYGTHYSSPALIIFFLSRSHPLFNLRLQSGNYGPADRLFQSIKLTWETAFNPGTDVMELIPEFYSGDGSFLINSLNLNLGKTQSGNIVNDVILPNWANSPKEFIHIMKSALESDIVSENLHNWIDLIFGYKQIGEKAAEFDNLFHHITYENNINIDDYLNDEKLSLTIQILEFGQTPKQLFKYEHPKKKLKTTFLLNDQILSDPFKEYILKFHKLVKDKEYLESKFEKIKRISEVEKENILSKFYLKAEIFEEEKKDVKNVISQKESEFKSIIETLLEQNKIHRENSQVYDKNKDLIFSKWVTEMKKNHMIKIEDDKANIMKYVNELENTLNKYKVKDVDSIKSIKEKKIEISECENEVKELKVELYELQRILRKIPHNRQIYFNQNNYIES